MAQTKCCDSRVEQNYPLEFPPSYFCTHCGLRVNKNGDLVFDNLKTEEEFKTEIKCTPPSPAILFLQKCIDIMQERYKQYGDYTKNIENVAKLCLDDGFEISPEHILRVLIGVKGARQLNGTKEDNFIDDINYRVMLYTYLLNKNEKE